MAFCILTCCIFFLPSLLFLFTFFQLVMHTCYCHVMAPCGLTFFLSCIHFVTNNAGVPSAAVLMSFSFYWTLWIWLLKTVHCTSLPLLGPCAVRAFTFSLPSLKFISHLFISYSQCFTWLANNSSSCLRFPVCGFAFLTQLIFLSQRWRQLVLIKLCHVFTKLHGITFQNVIICMQRMLFTLSNCNNLAHCFHNIEEKNFKQWCHFQG